MASKRSGLLILDTSCYKRLVEPALRNQLIKSARVADVEICPSVVNLFEILQIPSVDLRNKRLAVVEAFRGSKPLLPWPYRLLERVAQAMADRERGFRLPFSGLESLLEDVTSIQPKHISVANGVLKTIESSFNRAHARARPEIQRFFRERNERDPWGSAVAFLDHLWTTPSHLDDAIKDIWKKLKLVEPAPVELVLTSESWRIFFEGWGIAAYERTVLPNQPRWVQLQDLIQLVYLGGTPRRILVTADKSFQRAATAIIHQRYPGGRVLSLDEFINLSSV